jgi:hypothetical protein
MACDFITSGRLLECINNTSGLRNAYFAKWLDYGFTVTNSEMTGLGDLDEVFKFELKNVGNIPLETETSSVDNGTVFYDAKIDLVLTGLTAPLVNQAKLLSRDRSVIFIEDNNGKFHCFGIANGANKTTGTREIAGDLGGFYGLKMSFQTLEPDTAPILDSATVTSLLAIVSDVYVND